MSIGSILVGLVLFLATIPVVIKPLLKERPTEPAAADPELAASNGHRREEALVALRDLDFDHRLGKVTVEDYASLRASLLVQAAEVIQAEDGQVSDLDALIEEAVRARRRASSSPRACGECGATLHADDRFCRKCGASAAKVCPNCGQAAGSDDRFCAACGASLVASEAVVE